VTPLRKQTGVALIIVLWILILVTVATSSFALMARMDMLEANTLLSSTQARMAAESGINLAVVALRETDDEQRLMADGRVYTRVLDGILIEIEITDERGKLDINAADELTLIELFTGHGLDAAYAEELAAATLDWRDSDDAERVNGAELDAYEMAGLQVGPANRPFMMVEEFLQVIGMPFELYRSMEPGLTVHARSAVPNAAFAPMEALVALPDVSFEDAAAFVEERNELEPGDMMNLQVGGSGFVIANARGLTYSIRSKATMPNGVWDQIEATVRLGGNQGGQPYRVLRWREGFQY